MVYKLLILSVAIEDRCSLGHDEHWALNFLVVLSPKKRHSYTGSWELEPCDRLYI